MKAKPRTYLSDFICMVILLAIYILLFGCIRASYYEQYGECAKSIPCDGHSGQVYCYNNGTEWICCRCKGI